MKGNLPTFEEVMSEIEDTAIELEEKRKKGIRFNKRNRLIVTIISIVVFPLSIVVFSWDVLTGVFAVILSGLSIMYFISEFDYQYRYDIKYGMITAILDCFSPDLMYYPENSMLIDVINRGQIIRSWFTDRIDGQDYIKGYYKGNYMQFSSIVINRGLEEHKTVGVFRGRYLVCKFNKNFDSHTIVLQDALEKHAGFFGQAIQDFISRGKLVKLESADFERRFVVYSTDQVEARYLLSTTFMEKLMELYDKFDGGISAGFRNGNLHVAMRTPASLINYEYDYPVTLEAIQYRFYEPIYQIFNLIETFEVNQKLWSKQK